jgi:glycerol uptake facilitator-like aquaporin
MKFSLGARLTAEFIGTAFLVAAVVGSGVMGERLAGGNVAVVHLQTQLPLEPHSSPSSWRSE